MARADEIRAPLAVEVAWSPAPRQMLMACVNLPPGATIGDALRATGWPELAAALAGDDATFAAAGLAAAIWSHAQPLAHPLRDGDRVEILRPLQALPMDARRARFQAAGGVHALRKRGAAGRKG